MVNQRIDQLKKENEELKKENARLKEGLEGLAQYSCYTEARKVAAQILDFDQPMRKLMPVTYNTPGGK